jgi:hypothetical protein
LKANLPKPTLGAIDYAADKILTHASAGLLAFRVDDLGDLGLRA